jgi:hypothetical protein
MAVEEEKSETPEEEKKEEEKEGEDKEESPEEEKKEEAEEKDEKEEKMSMDYNIDMAALMAMLADETDEYKELVAKHEAGEELDKPSLMYAMYTRMCKMSDEAKAAKEDKDVYMAENASLKEFKDKIVLAKINVDEFPQTSTKFGIESIPNVFLFKNGKPVDGFLGLVPENTIKSWLKVALEK